MPINHYKECRTLRASCNLSVATRFTCSRCCIECNNLKASNKIQGIWFCYCILILNKKTINHSTLRLTYFVACCCTSHQFTAVNLVILHQTFILNVSTQQLVRIPRPRSENTRGRESGTPFGYQKSAGVSPRYFCVSIVFLNSFRGYFTKWRENKYHT